VGRLAQALSPARYVPPTIPGVGQGRGLRDRGKVDLTGAGLPLAVGIERGQRNEQKLVVPTLRRRFLKELPKRLIGDKAYDSDPLDAELAAMGIEMISPHHPRRRRKTQDGRPLRRYRRRWKIERLFAWIVRCRRLVTRYEHKAENVLGLLQLACARILWTRS